MNRGIIKCFQIVGLALVLLFILSACAHRPQKSKGDFAEKLVDFVVANADTVEDKLIELPHLYNSLVSEIPQGSNEKIVLAELLESKGFEVVTWGRGNFPYGARMISLTLKKGDCECRVDKMYYDTVDSGYYAIRERIQCKKLAK